MRRILLLFTALAATAHAQFPGNTGAPAENWQLPIFTKEGFRSMILRGTEVRLGSVGRYDVVDLNITTFTGGATPRVETVLLSPMASFFARDNVARGDKSVRLIRDDVEVTGEGWTYDHSAKKVSLARNTHVVIHAQLKDILK